MVTMSFYEEARDITTEWIEEYNDIRLKEAWDNPILYQYTTEKRPNFFHFRVARKMGT